MEKLRSKPYPRMTPSSCLEIVIEGRKLAKSVSKETLAGIGRADAGSTNSGAFSRKLASLDQYGLITYDKDTVTFTETTDEIALPTDEEKKQEALVKIFLAPPTFYELYEGLSKELPISLNLLRNKAQRELGISSAGVTRFLNNFIEAGELAGMLKYATEDKDAIKLISKKHDSIREEPPQVPTSKNIDIETAEIKKEQKIFQEIIFPITEGHAEIKIKGKLSSKDKEGIIAIVNVLKITETSNMEE